MRTKKIKSKPKFQTPQQRHNDCPSVVRLIGKPPHYAEIRCVKHNKSVQWLSKQDYQYFMSQMVDKPLL